MVTKRKTATLLAGLAAGVLGLAAWLGAFRADTGPRLTRESAVAARKGPDALPELVLLEPGTVVEGPPPPGWSDLVIKSVTYLASGDLDTLPAFARVSATRFRTVILADVRRDGDSGPFRLARVGAGIGVSVGGKDTIVSPESLETIGSDLSALDRMVLGRAERALGRSRIAARTPTFALYDSFVELADESGAHHSIILRYALVVDPASGRLRTAYWTRPDVPKPGTAPDHLALLPSGLIFRCGIHVAANRILGRLASSWGFAMTASPAGQDLPMPEALRAMAESDPEALAADRLERAVRAAIGDRPSPPAPSPP